jgi:hypothetical protein
MLELARPQGYQNKMRRWEASALSVALLAFVSGAAAQGTHEALIAKHAAANNLPESLVRRVIRIESRGNPGLVAKGNYGLMQIRLGTARAMGYRGSPQGLLDPDTNMTYAVKYLAGAYRRAGCNPDRAIANYQKGYRHAPGRTCPAPQLEKPQVAGAQVKSRSAGDRREKQRHGVALAQSQQKPVLEVAPTQANDVLKPRVVPTVSIPPLGSGPAASQAVPDPPGPVPPRAAPEISAQEPAANKARANLATEAVPASAPRKPASRTPGARRAHQRDVRTADPLAAKHASPNKRRHAGKKADAPLNLIGFLKRLVTPDKKSKTRKQRARAQGPVLR